MTRHTIVLAAAAAAASSILAVAQAHGSSSTALKLTVSATKISTVDVPPLITSKTSPETPGDEVLAVSRITGGARGHRYLDCAATQTASSIEKGLYACQLTYVLAGGTLTAAGVVHLDGTATAAITGGTGAYSDARGVLTSTPGMDIIRLD